MAKIAEFGNASQCHGAPDPAKAGTQLGLSVGFLGCHCAGQPGEMKLPLE
jgi:hypothetical protein